MRRTLLLLVAAGLLLSACTFSVDLSNSDDFSPTPSKPPKSSTSTSPSPTDAPDLVTVAAEDIQGFWRVKFPELYSEAYEELPSSSIYAMGQPGVEVPPCHGQIVTNRDWIGNAFYCLGDNYIVYDARSNGLMTELRNDYGEPSIAAVFAHEWGHAIQDRAGNTRVPTIYAELQADCFSGAWVSDAAADHSDAFDLRAGDLDAILGAVLSFRDAPGSGPEAADAHGSGFDRVSAFQDGYENSPSACVTYFDKPPIITEIPFTTRQEVRSGGNIAPAKVLPESVGLLNDFYSKVARKTYRPLKIGRVFTFDPEKPPKNMPECDTETLETGDLENQVYFCDPDHYVIVDVVYLQRVYDEIGDFGVATLLAGPWASYAQGLAGVADPDGESTAAADDCYTGGFAAALVNEALETKTLGVVQISAGDLDEAISAFIDADQVQGAVGDEVFARVDSFRDGFLNGYPTCKAYLPAP